MASSIPVYTSKSSKRNTGNMQIAETNPQKVLQLSVQQVAKFEIIRHGMSVAWVAKFSSSTLPNVAQHCQMTVECSNVNALLWTGDG